MEAFSVKSINFNSSSLIHEDFGTLNIPECKFNISFGVKKASILSSWGTTPIANLDCFLFLSMSYPHIETAPEVFKTTPEIIFINVDLPAPLGPSNPKMLPAGISREIFSKAKFCFSSL